MQRHINRSKHSKKSKHHKSVSQLTGFHQATARSGSLQITSNRTNLWMRLYEAICSTNNLGNGILICSFSFCRPIIDYGVFPALSCRGEMQGQVEEKG